MNGEYRHTDAHSLSLGRGSTELFLGGLIHPREEPSHTEMDISKTATNKGHRQRPPTDFRHCPPPRGRPRSRAVEGSLMTHQNTAAQPSAIDDRKTKFHCETRLAGHSRNKHSGMKCLFTYVKKLEVKT